MNIIFVASEMAPFSKTGGLADVTGSLPSEIHALGHNVITFSPRYSSVDILDKRLRLTVKNLPVSLGGVYESANLYQFDDKSGVLHYFVDYPDFFCRDGLYGTPHGDYPDNDQRFIFFQRAVLEAIKALKIKADVIHCHDWQAGLIPVYLKTLYAKDPAFKNVKTIFTIHNLGYQGNFPPDSFPSTGFGWDLFRLERLEFYGKFSFLKGGIVYADAVTTVSPSYAREIQSKEYGCGLEGVLANRKDTLIGITNGIDYKVWNPSTDRDLIARFSRRNLAKKAVNKKELQKENRLNIDPEIPLVGLVSRLVDQKGIDIVVAAFDEMMAAGIQVILLGTGEERYHQLFRDIAKQYRSQFSPHIVFDAKMAKRIYGGCDAVLIPSYYEPCGLAQMISLRYATIPIVRAIGGLADTIKEFDPVKGLGNGFRFEDYTARALVSAVKRFVQTFKDKNLWQKLVQNGLDCDFSWKASAKKYETVYAQTKRQEVRNLK